MILQDLFLGPGGRPSTFPDKKLTLTLIWCGAILLVFGMTLTVRNYQDQATRIPTTGMIIEHVLVQTEAGSDYYPRVRFLTESGQEVEFQSNSGFASSAYRLGDMVPVLYDPEDPNEAEISSFTVSKLPIVLAFMFGVLFCVLGFRRIQQKKI